MQTFLPYPDYQQSAAVLDVRRLGKQRVESLQILKALLLPNYGWKNHPAVRMWKGYESELVRYSLAICAEWTSRGYKDTCATKIKQMAGAYGVFAEQSQQGLVWLTKELCRSHQSNLLRKDAKYYAKHFPNVPSDLPYVWPTQQKQAHK